MSNEGDTDLISLCNIYEGAVVLSLYGSDEITEGHIENRLYNGIDTWWVKDTLIAISDENGEPVAVPALRYIVRIGHIQAA
jgi:hypothetical protein